MKKELIAIQVSTPTMKHWDDIKPTFLEVENPAEVAQSIATVTKTQVRMTRPADRLSDVGSYSGSYIQPQNS